MYDKPIRFQNHKGLNLISIRLSEIGNYFRFNKPLVTIWWDCSGSVGKCLSLLPYSPEYRNKVRDQLLSNLNEDYTNRYDELKEMMAPLLLLFPARELSLTFHNGSSGQYYGHTPLAGNYSNTTPVEWEMVLSHAIDLEAQQLKLKEYQHFFKEGAALQQTFEIHTKGLNAGGFYDGQSLSFVATQPEAQLNEQRVKHYEELISKGERPFAIIFNCQFEIRGTYEDGSTYDHSLWSDNYVIDGHHKLKAYQNLKVVPPVLEITHFAYTRDEINFNIEELIEVLYPWSIEHILKNWSQTENVIRPYLETKESNIHAFIKNGHIKRYNWYGNIYHEAFYKNDKIDGEAKWWHNNGQLEKIEFYKDGIPNGPWKSYFWTGELLSEVLFDNGQLKARKIYDRSGKLTEFEELDVRESKWIKKI